MFFLHNVNAAGRGQGEPVCDLRDGGARRDRTDDLMLAKHALYQLSYGPSCAPLALRWASPRRVRRRRDFRQDQSCEAP